MQLLLKQVRWPSHLVTTPSEDKFYCLLANMFKDFKFKRRNWSTYGRLFLYSFAGFAMLSHCFIWPIVSPIMTFLFPHAFAAHKMCWLTSVMTSLFSLGMGLWFAENIYAQREPEIKVEESGDTPPKTLAQKEIPPRFPIKENHKNQPNSCPPTPLRPHSV